MKSTVERIREEDPSFDPAALACEAAGIPRALYAAALNRVFYDGYYGPVSPEAWIEAHDEEEHAEAVGRIADALAILAKVSDEIEGYHEIVFAVDDDGEEVEWTEETVSAAEIRRDLLAAVYDIYGALPW
jgi:hypothetical protein